MNKIKHVWDPDIQEFVPEKLIFKTMQERLIKAWERFIAIDTIKKVLALSFVIRLVQLGKGAFWYDEGVSVVLSRLSWERMIQATAGDVHPPGYYIILWLIAKTGIPMTEFIARFPSLILSVIAVYLTWILIQRREFDLGSVGKWVVMGWVVISPLQLHYAQEARMYSLLQVEILLAIIFLLDNRKAFLSVVMTAILYTHNYAVFYIPTFVIVLLWKENISYCRTLFHGKPHWKLIKYSIKCIFVKFARNWLVWFIVPVLAWIPWFVILLGQMGTVAGGYWIQPVKLPSIIFVLYQMLFAYSMPPTFQGLGVLLSCGVLLYTGWRVFRDRPKGWEILVLLAFGPLVLSVFLSIVWKPVLLFRGLIGTAIPLIILVVKSLEGIRVSYKKVYAYLLIGVTLLAGTVGHYKYNAVNKGTTTTWVHDVVELFQEGDVILALNDNGIIAMSTYAPGYPLYKLEGCGEEAFGSLSPSTREAIGIQERSMDQLIPSYENAGIYEALQVYSRVFFISTIAPVSPQCEIDQANKIISGSNVLLIKELSNDEYSQAGVYLISREDIY